MVVDAGTAPASVSRRPKTIALLSPYSGRNLGDGAVHVAVIANLRALDPDIVLIGLTVDTVAMLRLHGLSSVTLVGTHSHFFYCDAATADPGQIESLGLGSPIKKRKDVRELDAPAASHGSGLRRYVRSVFRAAGRLPVAGPMAHSASRGIRRIWRMRNEPAHFVRSIALARRFDLILACGGGQYDEQWGGPWAHPYTLFRWSIIARLTRTPFAAASVGVGILVSRLGNFFVRRALAAATYRSFRDPGSRAHFADCRFTRNDPCVPDMAYSVPESMIPQNARNGQRRRVAVSPMIFGRRGIWPSERQGTYERYLEVLAEFTVWLMENGEDVCFYTSCRDDFVAVDELWSRMQRIKPDLEAATPNLLPSNTVPEVLRSLATVDLVVASRLHATVLAHRCGCPVVAISFERKVNADMEFFGHDDYILNIFTVETEPLKKKYLALAANAEDLRAQIRETVRAADAEIQRQYAHILTLAKD